MMPAIQSAIWSDRCPQCQSVNYYEVDEYDGDDSKFDTDGLRCWNCKHEWIITEVAAAMPEMVIDDAVIFDGRRK